MSGTRRKDATLGVEWEVQLIDAQTRMLRQDAGVVLAGLPGLAETGEHPQMRYELMQSTIEVVTGICGTVAEAKADLARSVKDLQQTAAPHGIVLAALRDARGERLARREDGAKPAVRRAASTRSSGPPGGCRPARPTSTWACAIEARVMPIINALAVYMPHILGLTASSPFWSGP